jgi:hypothetical protein
MSIISRGQAAEHAYRIKIKFALAFHAQLVNFEMQLAHATDDGLFGLVVVTDSERRVLLRELVQRL